MKNSEDTRPKLDHKTVLFLLQQELGNTRDTERLIRDITSTTKDLYSVDRQQGNFDVTVDHRLLSETGRKEIAKQEIFKLAEEKFGLTPAALHFYDSSKTTTEFLQDSLTADTQGATVDDKRSSLHGQSFVDVYGKPTHESIDTTTGQELGRQKDIQNDIADSADRTSMNAAMGEQYSRRLSELYASDDYSSYSSGFAHSLQNSQSVAAGRVDKKWSEVYPLDDASIADDVAAANELLDGFAQKQGKELFKDDDVVVNWFSEDPESDVYKDTSLFSENLTSGGAGQSFEWLSAEQCCQPGCP
ncbi:hypothetical protein RND59_00625 [Vibrio ruber]|uniref:hypothetical protein n=1 Tax=Vibrio ruber TaxID=184755 RepID=UPI002892BC42|nr:hypothetical protein [Vibrio ruber]WNJ95661.1 hypothetical protein RND59_00625 [Vibrio ruber]